MLAINLKIGADITTIGLSFGANSHTGPTNTEGTYTTCVGTGAAVFVVIGNIDALVATEGVALFAGMFLLAAAFGACFPLRARALTLTTMFGIDLGVDTAPLTHQQRFGALSITRMPKLTQRLSLGIGLPTSNGAQERKDDEAQKQQPQKCSSSNKHHVLHWGQMDTPVP